jgi:hypothetical protein
MNRRGVTVIELLIVCTIGAVGLVAVHSGWRAVHASIAMSQAVREVTQAWQSARAMAMESRHAMRAKGDDRGVLVQEVDGAGWKTRATFAFPSGVRMVANASPVFQANGFAAPLCTVELKGDRQRARITLSIAGRIRVVRAPE